MRRALVLLAALPLLVGCGSGDAGGTIASHPEGKVPAYFPDAFGGDGQVPAVVLRLDHDVALEPWTYCLSNGCADGAPGLGGPIDDAGSPPSVDFWFPEDGWTFTASFVPLGASGASSVDDVAVEDLGDGNHRLAARDLVGRYRVDIAGRREGGGDAYYSFLWNFSRLGGSSPDSARR